MSGGRLTAPCEPLAVGGWTPGVSLRKSAILLPSSEIGAGIFHKVYGNKGLHSGLDPRSCFLESQHRKSYRTVAVLLA